MNSLAALLARTSRTFALSIPRLPDPTRHAVTLAYLLFRIADTFEDAAAWPRAQRSAALDTFLGILRDPHLAETGALPPGVAETARAWRDARPSEHDGYLDLVAETPRVLDGLVIGGVNGENDGNCTGETTERTRTVAIASTVHEGHHDLTIDETQTYSVSKPTSDDCPSTEVSRKARQFTLQFEAGRYRPSIDPGEDDRLLSYIEIAE